MSPNLPSTILQAFEQIGTPRSVKSHQILINHDSKVDRIFLVKKGGLILSHVHPKSFVERAINFFIPEFHPLATAAEPFYLGVKSIYTLRSFTNSELIEIKRQVFEDFAKNSEYAEMMQAYGIKSLLEKNTLRAMLISLNSEEMLQYLHEHYPAIVQNIPSKYVADFLGITPQWLSKLKHKI